MSLDLDAFNDLANVDTEPDKTIIDRFRFDDALDVPHQLTDIDLWLNYCNDDLYHLDKAVREVIKKSRHKRMRNGGMRTAMPLVFLAIFGRKPEAKDSQVSVMMHRLLEYYCTKYTGISKISGVRFNRVYHFSKYACRSKRPMSLRLRLEEAADHDNEYNYRSYGAGKDKRAEPRPGVTAHGPLANGRGRVSE